MIALDPGTVLKKEYKGNNIKVVVTKSGYYKFNGKIYEDRGSLMKAILKGKTGQFTTFFGLSKDAKPETTNGEDHTAPVTVDGAEPEITIETLVRKIVKSEVRKLFKGVSNA